MVPNRETITYSIGALVLVCHTALAATDLDEILKQELERSEQARESQQRIDKTHQQAQTLLARYQAVNREISAYKLYNQQLANQIRLQQTSIELTKRAIDQALVIKRQIMPLLTRMVTGLEEFIELDVPFLGDERRKRSASLKSLLLRSDVSLAEKYRRVLEAYQIELEYGRTIESYRGSLQLNDETVEVEFLRLGRVGLYYRSLDERRLGMWDRQQNKWVDLDNDYRHAIRQGLRVARKQAAPTLLNLPVSAPREVNGQ